MILPSKHLSERRALLTVGSEILGLLDRPRTVSSVWEEVRGGKQDRNRRLSYDWFVLALDFLFLIGAVRLSDGLLTKSPSA
ncbi:MAG TPA: hypothetical protein DIT64_11955 [Verrucomicrobiales bacterium]|nr:hypothetical protein [Verrucomicrobiales bacterium]